MKKKYLLFAFFSLFMVHCSLLFASGKKDEDVVYLNDEWLLCITSFDYSMLPGSNRIAGDVFTRALVNTLDTVSYRLRISPEYAYYESYAWQQAVSAAAKALASKQDERSQLLFRGDTDWRYRQNIKKVDAEIVKLQEEFEKKEAEKPLIEKEPSFRLIEANISGTYPAPPKRGGERNFCKSQKADAFLTGAIREFHNRYYIQLRLFTLYTNSWVYEDDIIFSVEDSDGAVNEIAGRLTAVLAGNKPASVAITADPVESQLMINQRYAGRGTIPARERPPGKITVAIAAEGYMPETVETELNAGELTDIAVTLSPLFYTDVHINAPGSDGASVYQGALYVGETPLTLRLPLDHLEYFTVESWDKLGKGIFTTPALSTDTFGVTFKMKIPPPSGERRVNKARKWYYWAWGGTWITGIAAWITYGIYTSQVSVLSQTKSMDFYENTQRLYYVSMGTMIALGVAASYEVFQMARYMYTATSEVTPIIKTRRQRQ